MPPAIESDTASAASDDDFDLDDSDDEDEDALVPEDDDESMAEDSVTTFIDADWLSLTRTPPTPQFFTVLF